MCVVDIWSIPCSLTFHSPSSACLRSCESVLPGSTTTGQNWASQVSLIFLCNSLSLETTPVRHSATRADAPVELRAGDWYSLTAGVSLLDLFSSAGAKKLEIMKMFMFLCLKFWSIGCWTYRGSIMIVQICSLVRNWLLAISIFSKNKKDRQVEFYFELPYFGQPNAISKERVNTFHFYFCSLL